MEHAKVRIRQAKLLDINIIAELDKLSNKTPWSIEDYTQCLENPAQHLYVLSTQSGKIIGCIAVQIVLEDAEILQLVIHKEHQHLGYGRKLLNYMLAKAYQEYRVQQVFLEVRKDNHTAIALYTKCGFIRVGERKNYYHIDNNSSHSLKCCDALTMLYIPRLTATVNTI